MIKFQGVYLPDGEKHLVEWMRTAGEIVDGRGTYQVKKLRRAVSYCKQFRTAVDVGGHAGMWSMQLVKQFATVHAFEPVAAHRECFEQNVTGGNVNLHAYALGAQSGSVRITTAPTSSGDSYVDGDGDIPMRTLDSFELRDVDFIKIDTEGYELPILRGAIETIKRHMPVIIVEQKPGHAQRFGFGETDAVLYLQLVGYRTAAVMAGDFVMVPQR